MVRTLKESKSDLATSNAEFWLKDEETLRRAAIADPTEIDNVDTSWKFKPEDFLKFIMSNKHYSIERFIH